MHKETQNVHVDGETGTVIGSFRTYKYEVTIKQVVESTPESLTVS
jgi:hypothetical protein